MSKKINYYKIGIFITIGIVFLIALLIGLGGSQLFEQKKYIETYFNESVDGLKDGSPVKYLGITIGRVEQVGLLNQFYPKLAEQDKQDTHNYIYVKIAITEESFVEKKSKTFWGSIPEQIQKGLRMQIAPQGLTGGAMINIKYLNPYTNPTLPISLPESNIVYIPSATSTITRLTDAVNRLFGNLKTFNAAKLLEHIDTLTETANEALKAANVKDLSADTRKTLLSIAATANSYKALAQQMLSLMQKRQVNDTIDNVADITKTLKQTTIEATKTLQSLNKAVISSDQILAQFKAHEQQILTSTTSTARNLQQITNNAKAYPSQVLFGDPPPRLDPSKL